MSKQRPFIQYKNTVPGIFSRRINRFVAEVLIDGKKERVHVKNTGRLQELLVPDAKVTLQIAKNPERSTAYDLISVYKPRLRWVNIDSLAPNELMKQHLMSLNYDVIKPEYNFGDSRFDFYMERDGERYLTEVKGCTLAADLKRGIGLFPDAPTKRGVKHLDELAAAAKEGYHCEIAFVIQMNGIHMVFPNCETQPEFGQALIRAARAGVQVACYGCHVEADSIKITGVAGDAMRYASRPEIQEISREQRIAFYEEIFDELQAADPAAGISVELQSKYRILEEYYTSAKWREDYEADEAGQLSPDLKRGVLSQDGVYDLLERLGEKL